MSLKNYYHGTLILWILLLLCLWSQVIRFAPYSGDDGYYLYNAALVHHDNLLPIKDFVSHYSPGYMYAISLIWTLAGESYTAMLTVVMLLAILSTLLMATTLKTTSDRLLFASLFLPSFLIYEGGQPYLEVFVVPFACAAYAMLNYKKNISSMVIIGVLFGTGLMLKQTFIVFLPAFLLGIYWQCHEKRWKSIASFIFALTIPFLLFCALTGLNLFNTADYLMNFAHEKYNRDPSRLTYILEFHLQFPFTFLSILLSFIWLTLRHFKEHWLAIITFSCAALPCLLQPFYHYVLFVLPWGVLIWVAMVNIVSDKCKQLYSNWNVQKKHVALSLSVLMVMIFFILEPYYKRFQDTGRLFNTFYGGLQPITRQTQYDKAAVVHQWWKQYGDLFVFGNAELQYLSKIRLPHHRATYGFLTYHRNEDKLIEVAKSRVPVVIVIAVDRRSSALMIPLFQKYGYREVQSHKFNVETLILMSPRSKVIP